MGFKGSFNRIYLRMKKYKGFFKEVSQFIRLATSVLLAGSLIVGLLPGCTVKPSQPSGDFTIPTFQEDPATTDRRTWVAERFRGEKIVPNGKFAPKVALARLALNPDDAGAIESITHFWDNVPEGRDAEQFTFAGVAWVLGKYWDKFTPAQRDHLKARVKDLRHLMGHGTPNHAIMKCIAAYLFAERWPNEDGWIRGQYSSEQILQASRARILNVVNGYYDKNDVEWISENYFSINLWPFHALYDCARDPEIKHAAYAALCYHYASLAANTFRGSHISPFARGRLAPQTGLQRGPGSTFLTWLYAGPEYTEKVPATDGSNFAIGIDAAAISAYAAVSDFVMPPAILSLWRGETAPYELTSSSAGFVYGGVTPGFWGTGEPGETSRYIYRHPDYAIGSGFIEYYPDAFYTQHHSNVSILYRSTKEWSVIETHHPYWRSNTREWDYGNNSPFIQTAQYKSAAIAIFNIPETDPWAGRGGWQSDRDQHFDKLIQEAFVRYPKSIDEMVEANGWVFLREGNVYIAIRPLRDYTIETNPVGVAGGQPVATPFNAIRSAFAQTGFVYDVATGAEFASFAAFRAAAIKNPPGVNWNTLSVTYTSLAGDKITATWNPPDYSGPPQTGWSLHDNPVGDVNLTLEWRPGLSGGNDGGWSWDDENKIWSGPPGDKWYPGSRVLVRPHITINGAVLPPPREYTPDRRPGQDPADFDYYIPMKSPSANIADGVLSVQTPGGKLTVYAPGKK
jgi:hypothetical protein